MTQHRSADVSKARKLGLLGAVGEILKCSLHNSCSERNRLVSRCGSAASVVYLKDTAVDVGTLRSLLHIAEQWKQLRYLLLNEQTK